jgi:hypothetical protein
MKQNMLLDNPVDRGNGLTQTHLLVDYIYVLDNSLRFHSVQGNAIEIPLDVTLQGYLTAIENAAKVIYDVP